MSNAVFIGSSNVSTSAHSWPEKLSAKMGVTCYNYAIGGGGFTQLPDRNFTLQVNNALAGMSPGERFETAYFFVADAGNDMRACNSVSASAPAIFASIKENFVNARIIVLPALWGLAELNMTALRMRSVTTRAREIREAGLPYGIEFIDQSWTWHYDNPAYMLPGEVHYTAAGHDRIVDFILRFLNGSSTDSPTGWVQLAGNSANVHTPTELYAKREMNAVTLTGIFGVKGQRGLDTEIAQLPPGMAPMQQMRFPIVDLGSRNSAFSMDIFDRGLIRSFGTVNGSVYHVNAVLPLF